MKFLQIDSKYIFRLKFNRSMKRVVLKLVVLIILPISLIQCTQKEKEVFYNKKYKDEVKQARKEVVYYMVQNSVPGATFAVSKGGELLYSDAVGLASKDLNVPVTRKTKFRIGKLSENFTALLYHMMVEEGTLHPDSTVQHYFPEFPEKQHRLTLKDLAQQTSGIREPSPQEKDWRGLNVSLEKGLEQFMNDSLVVPPGLVQIPSLFNYNLLGVVMEKATGNQFSRLLEEYITDTLQLTNTTVDNPFITIEGRTNYFDHNFIAQVIPATFRDMRHKAPSEGILSNAEDLVKFGNALLYSDNLSAEVKSRIFEPIILPNDMPANSSNGWIKFNDNSNRTIYGISSTVTGGSAAILIYPEEELVVAYATNLNAISDDAPVFRIASQFLPEEEQEDIPEPQE